MSESLAEQAARLGIVLGEKKIVIPTTANGTPRKQQPRKREGPPGPRGAPRRCEHSDRRPLRMIRGGKEYTVTYCRTCSTAREAQRMMAPEKREERNARQRARRRLAADKASGA